jgi:peptidoglycan/xylan/chitin deacetylase (PgdA/CDA1 family)
LDNTAFRFKLNLEFIWGDQNINNWNLNKQIIFRFDVDTHVCLKDGVPNLINLAARYNIKFTFFVNTGRSIHHGLQLKRRLGIGKESDFHETSLLSARRKLGNKGFIEALLINPRLAKHWSENINAIIESGHELGLHGGRNHDQWHREHYKCTSVEIENDIKWGLQQLNQATRKDYKVIGFSSPGWASSSELPKVLAKIKKIEKIYSLPTNMIAEPGGVSLLDHWVSLGFGKSEIIKKFEDLLRQRERLAVFYEHPYFAGREGLPLLDAAIQKALDLGYNFLTFRDLLACIKNDDTDLI